MLWFAFIDSPELLSSVSVPIEFRNAPRGFDIGSDSPDDVQLQLSGPRQSLVPDRLSGVAVVLDLAPQTRAGERTYNVTEYIVGLPLGVSVVRATPTQLRVILERRLQRELPIRLRLPNGYTASRYTLQPSVVKVSGPESRVKNLTYVETDELDLGGDDTSGERTLTTRLNTYVNDPRVRIDSASVVEVNVTIEPIR